MLRYLCTVIVSLLCSFYIKAQTDSLFTVTNPVNGHTLKLDTLGGLTVTGTLQSFPFSEPGVTGNGTRMMWIANFGAFRAGSVVNDYWNAAHIGSYSAAFGNNVRASGDNSFAVGNYSQATQQNAVAMGDQCTASGAASVALGYHAHTNARQGSFVFADRSSVDTLRAGVNHSANWRVSGGFRIFTASNLSTGVTIQSGSVTSNWGQSNAVISTSTGALLSTAGVWTNSSDVNRKRNFLQIDGEDVLSRLRRVPITTWSYKVDSDSVRHLGPMAQDFRAAFGLGNDDVTIGTVD